MKGTGFIAFILIMTLASLPMTAMSALATSEPANAANISVSVSSPGTLAPGDEFSIQVDIIGNPGFAAAAFQIIYDSGAFELLGFGPDGMIRNGMFENLEQSSVGFFTGSNINGDGLLFSANFRVKAEAPDGDYIIQLDLRDGMKENFVDASTNSISVSFTPATVQVSGSGSPGNEGGDQPPAEGNGDDISPGGQGGANGNNGSNSNNITDVSHVTAVAPDGTEIDFMMRRSNGNREYSLDEGETWEMVPQDGIIVTPEGESISIDGNGRTDYVVVDLPPALTAGRGLFDGLSDIPPQIIIGVTVIAISLVLVLLVVMRRRGDSRRRAR